MNINANYMPEKNHHPLCTKLIRPDGICYFFLTRFLLTAPAYPRVCSVSGWLCARHNSSECIAQVKAQGDLDAGIGREDVPVGEMPDIDLGIEMSLLPGINAHPHIITEGEFFSGVLFIQLHFGDEGGPCNGIIEIEVGRPGAQGSKPQKRINRQGEKMLAVEPGFPVSDTCSHIQ